MVKMISVPTPFEIGPVNLYILSEHPLTVVDIGPKHPETIKALTRQFALLGYKLSDIEQVVLTHPHPDHSGLSAWIKHIANAKILSHPYTAFRVSGNYYRDGFNLLRQTMISLGIPEEISKSFIHDDNIERLIDPVEVDVILLDGQCIDIDHKKWEIIYTPGHSMGQICLYNKNTKEMISGDHILPQMSSNPVIEPPMPGDGVQPQNLRDYRDSLKRIQKLRIDKVYPGHGPVFNNCCQRIKTILEHHKRQKSEVLKAINKTGMTVFEISRKIFPYFNGFDIFFGISLVKGHLDILNNEGLIELYNDNPIMVRLREL